MYLFLTCFSLTDLCGADNGCHAVADAYPDCYLCVGNNQRHHSIHVKVRLFWLDSPDLCLGNNQQHHAIHVRVWLSWLYSDHNTCPDLSVCFGNNQWHHSNHVTYYDCSDCLCHGWTVLAFLCDGKYSASFLTHCGQGTMFCYIHPCSAKAILMATFQRFQWLIITMDSWPSSGKTQRLKKLIYVNCVLQVIFHWGPEQPHAAVHVHGPVQVHDTCHLPHCHCKSDSGVESFLQSDWLPVFVALFLFLYKLLNKTLAVPFMMILFCTARSFCKMFLGEYVSQQRSWISVLVH